MPHDSQFDKLSPAKQALYEIRSLKEKLAQLEQFQSHACHEPVAIIGFALRFPGDANDAASFWNLLAAGTETASEIPASRWDLTRFYDPDPDAAGKMTTRHGSFLRDPSLFDPHFFSISPREAVTMDPQQRLALEVAWEALESSGHNPIGAREHRTGVFFALSNSDYARMVFARPADIDAYSSTGNNLSVVSGRISYTFGFHGPSMVVDTACSGSLVAIHLAAQSLRARECRTAIAGGVNLILSPEININFSRARMMSADGRCKTFDARADGFVRGEGCGVVVLKRLSDAIEDRDNILAILRGSAVNQDGRSSGLTAPNGVAQENVIRAALEKSGASPNEIDYIEAHGTGTELGDPIEAHALSNVFAPGRGPSPLTVGSVKTNLGHLESAAGIAGLIKVILSLRHSEIPKHLHFQKMNPHIDWGSLQIEIPVHPRKWNQSERKRLAGVSSFGFSGTNAHLIVEEAPSRDRIANNNKRPLHILTLSARDEKALHELREKYLAALASTHEPIADICFTANAGRAAFDHRLFVVGADTEELRHKLEGKREGHRIEEVSDHKPVFLFPGQGSQFHGMGKQLYDTQPIFRAAIDECAAILKSENIDLLAILWGSDTEKIHDTANTQVALFTIEWALAQLWKSWGVEPAAILGHSVGEYVGVTVAGVYTLAEGLKLIALRGRLMSAAQGHGAMLAVIGDEAKLHQAIQGIDVSIAAENAPGSFTLAGYTDQIDQATDKLTQLGLRAEKLKVSHAFHSAQMDQMRAEFEQAAAQLQAKDPQIRLISSVTGRELTKQEITPQYWGRQIRDTVRFRAAMETIQKLHHHTLLEVGPGTTLCGLGRQTITSENTAWLPTLRRQKSDWEQTLDALGQYWQRGGEVDWEKFDAPYAHARYRVPLPTYPFQRQSYWLASTATSEISTSAAASAPPQALDAASTWQLISESAARQSNQGRLDLSVSLYSLRWAFLNRLTTAYIVDTLKRAGIFQRAAESHTVDSLLAHANFQKSYARLLRRWLSKLVSEDLLKQATPTGEFTVKNAPLTFESPQAILESASPVFSGDRIFLDYAVSCGADLLPILTGRKSALETLFPNGNFERAENIYERAPVSAYFASVARAALEAMIRARGAAPLRILEIGAGTGSTASQLIPLLAGSNSTYEFTDVSDIFLDHGRRKFAAHPQVSYRLLDIEKDPAALNFSLHDYDVIIATNALHATRDLRATMARVHSLLAPAGLLILCESTKYLPWFDITTALIEGWQRFDDGLRHDHPLLDAKTWSTLLSSAGFERVDALPHRNSPAEVLGQHVILASTHAAPAHAPVAQLPARAQAHPQLSSEKKNGHGTTPAHTPTKPALNLAALPPHQRHDALLQLIQQQIAELLHFDSIDRVEPKRRLLDLGLDSLMAIELRNRLARALQLEKPLSSTLVFDFPTPDAVATHLERDVLATNAANESHESRETSPASPAFDDSRIDEIAELDDDAVEELLKKKLQSL
jgi:acyl transferase domain-containing protein/SAM-dependent methyltransferase/acyl carrier protein